MPPGSKETFELRNVQLRGLASLAGQSKGMMILIGDLNVTPWSPDYARLIRDSGLRDARRGHGILPTWPTFFPLMMIPLDHCLISPTLAVSDIRLGPNIGSDHLPLIVDLLLPTTPMASRHK
jgi:endonuclease/exonuclease/phosphatase (EEP) superfamily protein YafD